MDFDNIAIDIDSDCANQDFDEYDLFGEIMVGDDEELDTDIEFE